MQARKHPLIILRIPRNSRVNCKNSIHKSSINVTKCKHHHSRDAFQTHRYQSYHPQSGNNARAHQKYNKKQVKKRASLVEISFGQNDNLWLCKWILCWAWLEGDHCYDDEPTHFIHKYEITMRFMIDENHTKRLLRRITRTLLPGKWHGRRKAMNVASILMDEG